MLLMMFILSEALISLTSVVSLNRPINHAIYIIFIFLFFGLVSLIHR